MTYNHYSCAVCDKDFPSYQLNVGEIGNVCDGCAGGSVF